VAYQLGARAKSEELREDRRWEIEDGDKKIWVAKFQHPPSSRLPSSLRSYDATRRRDKKGRSIIRWRPQQCCRLAR